MASIYKRGKTWTASVSTKVDGQLRKKTKSGFSTKTEANKWATSIEQLKNTGKLPFGDRLFKDEYWSWYMVFKEPHIETNTKSWYISTYRLISSQWPDMKLSDVTVREMQLLINGYAEGHVKSSVTHIKNMLGAFCRYAVDEGMLAKDISRNIVVSSKKKSAGRDTKFLEHDQFLKLIEAAKTQNDIASKMILTACYSGCRYSEIAALSWNDFDFKKNTITINKSWSPKDSTIKGTKTKTSVRTIDMPEEYMKIAKSWTLPDKIMFTGLNGKPLTDGSCNIKLNKLLATFSTSKLTMHGLRHTHASYLLANDIDIQYVSERLGHAGIEITMKVYAHLMNEKRDKEKDKTITLLENL